MKIISLAFLILLVVLPSFAQDLTTDRMSKQELEARYKQALLEAKIKYENEYPVFSQKGGMLRPYDNSFYLRTEDEWTGFSTLFLGYRYAVNDFFNIAIEGGAGLPQVYLANVLLHLRLIESPGKLFFFGMRTIIGYKFQNAEQFMHVINANGNDTGYLGLGKDYLTIKNRYSIYFSPQFTIAFRVGKFKEHCIYYTVYPRLDFNIQDGSLYSFIAPVMIGYEVRFGYKMEWSFAIEGGYTIPLPWGSVPDGKWVNFPSLANIGFYYRFGDKFYWKANQEKIKEEVRKKINAQ